MHAHRGRPSRLLDADHLAHQRRQQQRERADTRVGVDDHVVRLGLDAVDDQQRQQLGHAHARRAGSGSQRLADRRRQRPHARAAC